MQFFQIKITLKHTTPPIWRRIVVAPEIELDRLHAVLQMVMGWDNSHLYEFETSCGRFSDSRVTDSAFELEETESSAKITLKSVLTRPRSSIRYEYDFGDGWDHQILLEKVVELDEPIVALCLGGARSCPPEDCGGPWGYANLLEIMKDPKHSEHKSMSEWIGPRFDPESFNVEAIDKQLARLAPPRQKKASAKKAVSRSAKRARLQGV
jgi:hypothetical protein